MNPLFKKNKKQNHLPPLTNIAIFQRKKYLIAVLIFLPAARDAAIGCENTLNV